MAGRRSSSKSKEEDPDAGLVGKLYQTAMDGPAADSIHATAFYKFALSPFGVWCDRFAPESEKDSLDDFQKLLFEQGRTHEQSIVSARFPDAKPVSYDTEEDGFRLVLEAMHNGVKAIHGAPLFFLPEGLRGRADVLERRDDSNSVFGAHYYVVKEIKLARNIRDHHRLQAAVYNHILGRLQGITPRSFYLINRDGDEFEFSHDPTEFERIHQAIQIIRAGQRPPAVRGGGVWPWESYTDRMAEEARDISCIGGVGPSFREKLVAAGLNTFDDLAKAEVTMLKTIKGIGEKTASKFRMNAQAVVQGTHIQIGHVSYPEVETEIFLDLEGTGAQTSEDGLIEMDYLIGVLLRKAGKEEYIPFVANSLDDEGRMFSEFVTWLSKQSDYEIYHWHHYESTHLKKLAERHGLDAEMQPRLFGKLRDLYKDATGAFAFPTYSTSIKSIAPYMGFNWRHKDVNAMASIALYFEYAKDPNGNGAKLQKILDYNEDDCIAMRVAKDWLSQNGSPTAP